MTHDELAALPLPERVAWLITEHGPTQDGLATKLGTSRSRVNKWRRGKSKIGREKAELIAALSDTAVELWSPDAPSAADLATLADVARQAADWLEWRATVEERLQALEQRRGATRSPRGSAENRPAGSARSVGRQRQTGAA